MEKKCSCCKEIKDETFFYKNKNSKKDGLQSTCKKCSYIQTKQSNDKKRLLEGKRKTKRDGKFLTLSGIKQEDYCQMYKMLSKMGYDITKNISVQFAEKYSLLVSNKQRRGVENHWTYKDCQE